MSLVLPLSLPDPPPPFPRRSLLSLARKLLASAGATVRLTIRRPSFDPSQQARGAGLRSAGQQDGGEGGSDRGGVGWKRAE